MDISDESEVCSPKSPVRKKHKANDQTRSAPGWTTIVTIKTFVHSLLWHCLKILRVVVIDMQELR